MQKTLVYKETSKATEMSSEGWKKNMPINYSIKYANYQ